VRLAGAAVAQQQKIFLAREELAPGQLQYQCFVQRRDSQEVEAIEAFDHRKLRLPDAALGGAAVAVE